MDLQEEIRSFGKRNGMPEIGCIPDSPDHRFTPKGPLLSGQKAFILCLFPYPAHLSSPHISAYALFPDYHIHLKKKLTALENFIKSVIPEVNTRIFADTSPVLEKPLAARAGLGYQGKNTLLIHPQYGSYLFLGGIALDRELSGSMNVSQETCGQCRLCLDACPTQALSEKGLDTRFCLSYHTIENRGEIPDTMRDKMGVMAFGCGLCEKVCPRNEKAASADYPDWKGNTALSVLTLQELLETCERGFKKYFEATPLFRPGKKRLIRNLLIAMGNSGRKEYIVTVKKYRHVPGLEAVVERDLKKLEDS